jgi:threonylcarbamoyladenosine tRNA methylthiotransferase MtaB
MGVAFHIENFGCRAARADGEAVGERLRAVGLTENETSADVVVVNTCSVTAEADRAARAFIRRTHRRNPAARIVVTGCYAQRAPGDLAGIPGVTAVIGNSHKALAPDIVLSLVENVRPASASAAFSTFVPVQSLLSSRTQAPIWADDRFAHSFLEDAQLIPDVQTRPNLKIQEGCGNRCTFCVIPLTRGPSRSLSAEAILKQVRAFVIAGGNELVLSGINLGRWGRDLAFDGTFKLTLPRLIRVILEQSELPRLRLSSVEPMDWDSDLIALMREFGGTRLARHAHLPLQSGSDTVLRRMHRRYRPWHYAQKVTALLDAAGADLTLGADVMVGFPGESDREFEDTLQMVRDLPFGYLHLFPFSPRPATAGWELHATLPVPAAVVEERMATLRALAAKKSKAHRSRFIGSELDAITLHTPAALQAQGRTSALTENFLPVEIGGQVEANRLVRLRICGVNSESVLQAGKPNGCGGHGDNSPAILVTSGRSEQSLN